MKKTVRLIALCLALVLLLLPATSVSASGADNINAEQEARGQQINDLLSARRQLLASDPVNLAELDSIDVQLYHLGVEFYTDSEAAILFPEASAAVPLNQQLSADMFLGDTASPNYDIDDGFHDQTLNIWTTYRTEDYYYEGAWLNIQHIVVTPINQQSSLWDEGNSYHDYSDTTFFVVTEDLINVTASAALGAINPPAASFFDALSMVWGWMRTDSEIAIDDITYVWECSTTLAFTYVRNENESDLEQRLTTISSECEVEVGAIVDMVKYRRHFSGTTIEEPELEAINYDFITRSQHFNSSARSADVYMNSTTYITALDYINSIDISAAGNKSFLIYPAIAQFPAQIE